MKTVSAVIIVKNNPPHLFETLNSLNGFVSEIIIGNIDMGNDYRKRLLQNKKVKIVELPSNVPFADLIKEDLKKKAKGEYILYLDPDEIFPSTTLRASPSLSTLMNKYDIFYFPRKNIIFGKWIEHSRWWPDYQLRLFRKDSVIWPKELHPVPRGKGKEFKLEANEKNAILHYNYDNLDQFIEKSTRYAKSEAKSLIQKNENYTLTHSLQKSLSEFIGRFFSSEGYKDGMHGFTLSILQMFYYFLVYFYFWEMKKYAEVEKNLPGNIQKFTHNLYFESNFWLVKKNLLTTSEKLKLRLQNKIVNILK